MILPMGVALFGVLVGFVLLIWSADRFVEGAAVIAAEAGMSPLLVGMLIVGFGTSAPEMVVSAMAASDGNPELALGNALGSNITNTGLILGVTALVAPIVVRSKIIRRELPILLMVCAVLGALLRDGALSRLEASSLLLGFGCVIAWSLFAGLRSREDTLGAEMDQELSSSTITPGKAVFWLVVGLIMLVVSSRILVVSAVSIATGFGVDELIIGLTVVALGTSLPELAASVIAARRGEHDIAIGNVVGSNLFNLLAVIGIAGFIAPFDRLPEAVLLRDWAVMVVMTLLLLVTGLGWGRQGRISRPDGLVLLAAYVGYSSYLAMSAA